MDMSDITDINYLSPVLVMIVQAKLTTRRPEIKWQHGLVVRGGLRGQTDIPSEELEELGRRHNILRIILRIREIITNVTTQVILTQSCLST